MKLGIVLPPGDYLVELAFDRPCRKDILQKALHAMGWSDVSFDLSETNAAGTTRVGQMAAKGAPSGAAASSTVQRAATRATPQTSLQQAATASPAITSAVQRATAVTPEGAARSTPKPPAPPPATFDPRKVAYDGARLAPGVPRQAASPAFSATVQKAAQAQAKPSKSSKYDSPISPAGKPGESVSSPGSTPEESAVLPEDVILPTGEGGGGGGYEEQERAVMPPLMPDDPSEIREQRILLLWTKWVEWGSPFALSPRGDVDRAALDSVQIAGDISDAPTSTRVRFVGRLQHALEPSNPPGMRWMFARRLTVDPFATLDWNAPPSMLRNKAFYEMRMLVREKTAPSRETVKHLLAATGFAPAKLTLLQKNIRFPGRPASLAAWVAIGQWLYPDSVTTVEDPFWFERVKEIAP